MGNRSFSFRAKANRKYLKVTVRIVIALAASPNWSRWLHAGSAVTSMVLSKIWDHADIRTQMAKVSPNLISIRSVQS